MRNGIKLAVLAVAAIAVIQVLVQKQHPAPSGPKGEPAPALAYPDLAGKTLDLASLRGKVVVVNFWATWCPPCQAEIPDIAAFWQKHQGRCLEVVGVAEESAREDIAEWAKKIPYRLVVDERATALDAWKIDTYPRTFIVDADGHVAKQFQGAVDQADLEAAVKPILPDTCPAS